MNITYNYTCGSYLNIEEHFYSDSLNDLITGWLTAHPHFPSTSVPAIDTKITVPNEEN